MTIITTITTIIFILVLRSVEFADIRMNFSTLHLLSKLGGQVLLNCDEMRAGTEWWMMMMMMISELSLSEKNTGLFGSFSQHGGGGIFPNPKTFVILPSKFWHAKIFLRC